MPQLICPVCGPELDATSIVDIEKLLVADATTQAALAQALTRDGKHVRVGVLLTCPRA